MNLFTTITIVIAIIVVLYVATGLIYATFFKINHYHVNIQLKQSQRIAQLSDMHVRKTSFKILKKTINHLNNLKADVLIFTGDLYDHGDVSEKLIQRTTALLNQIKIPKKIAIYGNHDVHFSTIEAFERTMHLANFKILKDELIEINGLNFYGINSIISESAINLIAGNLLPNDTIMLSHEPDTFLLFSHFENIKMQISGHSHKGQVIIPPFGKISLPLGARNYYKKYYTNNKRSLYICPGVGNSQKNIRFFVKHEINLYIIN